MKKNNFYLLIILFSLLLLIMVAFHSASSISKNQMLLFAPEFTSTTLDGVQISLSTLLSEKVVLLYFFPLCISSKQFENFISMKHTLYIKKMNVHLIGVLNEDQKIILSMVPKEIRPLLCYDPYGSIYRQYRLNAWDGRIDQQVVFVIQQNWQIRLLKEGTLSVEEFKPLLDENPDAIHE